MRAADVREGVGMALDALRSDRVRAFLTVLGVVIGVATVMLVAAFVGGIRSSVLKLVESSGPGSFSVWRFDPDQIRLMGSWEEMWAGNPRLTLRERDRIASLASVESASALVYNDAASLRLGSQELGGVFVIGQGADWPRFSRGDFVEGRNFLPAEEAHSAPVVVLSSTAARALAGDASPVGQSVRIGREQLRVVGVYREEMTLGGGENQFSAWVPVTTALKRLDMKRDFLRINVVPAPDVAPEDAIDDVVVALRSARGLRPGKPDSFVIKTNQALAEMSMRWADAFSLVMLVLSSIGLLVGGVGVVAIMMISVTERTREIGVRKALGATRREILWQFLVEAATITTAGGLIGTLVGGGGAVLVSWLAEIPAAVPLWSVLAALAMSALSGIGFGLYPAVRAARLDPVDALRHE